MPKNDKMQSIKIDLPVQLIARLNRIKAVKGIPRSHIIRQGLDLTADHYEKKLNLPPLPADP